MAMCEVLTIENHALVREWDFEKNGDLRPEDFTGGSNKKVWWLCDKGHSWFAQINKRFISGRGCPYCSGQKVWPGFNDLVTTHPQIAEEWDYEKNGSLRPERFSAGADIKIWWKCRCGHSWQALIYSRKNCGCPACAGKILKVGINDFQTVNPVLALEWDMEKNGDMHPDSVSANSNRKAWWRCVNEHSWQAAIYSRNRGKGCPYCSKRYVLAGFNDLLTEAPELAKEWDYGKNAPLSPEMIVGTSNKAVWWICSRGHSWKTQILKRRIGTGCPYCAGKLVIPGETDLKTLRPDLAAEWNFERNGLQLPEQVTAQSHWNMWWICSRGHSYKATVANRFRGNGCPYCAGKLPILGETDLQTVHPELILDWDFDKNGNLRPDNFTVGSHKKIWWHCAEGHSWRTDIYNRHKGCGCPYCSGLLAICGETDIGTVNPMLASEWDYERNAGILPDEIKPYSNKKVWWVCQNGHHWLSTVGARHAGSNCPYCQGKIQMRTRLVK